MTTRERACCFHEFHCPWTYWQLLEQLRSAHHKYNALFTRRSHHSRFTLSLWLSPLAITTNRLSNWTLCCQFFFSFSFDSFFCLVYSDSEQKMQFFTTTSYDIRKIISLLVFMFLFLSVAMGLLAFKQCHFRGIVWDSIDFKPIFNCFTFQWLAQLKENRSICNRSSSGINRQQQQKQQPLSEYSLRKDVKKTHFRSISLTSTHQLSYKM